MINLVTHSEIEIACPPEEVWPHVLDPNDWKQGLLPVRVSGEANEVGEVRRASVGEVWLAAETVALEAPVRKVVKLTTGGALDPAWAAWQLRPSATGTVVSYDVYGEIDVPDEQALEYVAANQQRFDAELLALKELVEP